MPRSLRKLSVPAKIHLVVAVGLAATTAVVLLSLIYLGKLHDRIDAAITEEAERVRLASLLERDLVELARAEKNMILAVDQAGIDRFTAASETYRADLWQGLRQLETLLAGDRRSLIDQFEGGLTAYLTIHDRVRQLASRNANREAFELSTGPAREAFDRAASAAAAIVAEADAELTHHQRESQQAYSTAVAGVLVAAGLGIVLSVLLAYLAIRIIKGALSRTVQVTRAVEAGDLDARVDIHTSDELGELGAAFNSMADGLREQFWLSSGQTELDKTMSGNPDAEELGWRVIRFLCKHLDAQLGSFYLAADDAQLTLVATSAAAGVSPSFAAGQGLPGRVAREQEQLVLTGHEADAVRLNAGLGEITPACIIEQPLVHYGRTVGVIELASATPVSEAGLHLLERACPAIAVAVQAASDRERIAELLDRAQSQTEELEAQQEELRQTNDELTAQAQLLEEERENVEQRNRDLAQARQILQERADELATVSQYKSDFLATMSHELRTPLNSLLILAKLLGENSEGNLSAKQIEYANTIHASGAELLTLINEILDLAKIESGKVQVEIVDLTVPELKGYLERNFAAVARERGLDFDVRVDPECPTSFESDVQRLHQVLKNLLSNAFKFTEEGRVRVELAPAPERYRRNHPSLASAEEVVAISVRDTGPGIPEEQLEVIFEAFRQGDTGSKRRYAGTGLGLSISREIARLLGGELTVSSAVGEGSTFTLYLPVHYTGQSARALAPKTAPPAAARDAAPVRSALPAVPDSDQQQESGVRRNGEIELPPAVIKDDRDTLTPDDRILLIIEDDLRFAAIMRDMARERGFKVLVAGDGSSGVSMAQATAPDAITLDIRLPDMTGWTALDRLKHDPISQHIPIHIVTIEDERDRAFDRGALTFLGKPVDRDLLAQTMDEISRKAEKSVKNLLVVEDDDVERQSIVDLIGNSDVVTTAVATAADAVAALADTDFDCVVLDLGLPDMSGFDLIDALQEKSRHAALPIVVYTGRDLNPEEQRRLKSSTDAVILKDADSPERLMAETTMFLNRVERGVPRDKHRMIRKIRGADSDLQGKRVLLVDDDMRNIFALSGVLEDRGMEVLVAENGREALDVVDSQGESIGVILMDMMMPVMDGYQTTRQIRKTPPGRKLPIIAVTAKAMKEDRQKCLDAGANDYITKPVDIEQLLSVIRVWMYERDRGVVFDYQPER